MLIEHDSKHHYDGDEALARETVRSPVLRTVPAPPPALAMRQRQILWLASQGKNNNEIGRELCITANTVKSVMATISRKMGAEGRSHAVAIAYRCGLFSSKRPPTNRPDCMHITWARPGDRASRAERCTIVVADQGRGAWSVRHCGRWWSTDATWDHNPGSGRPPDWLDTHTFLYSNAIEIAQHLARHLMSQKQP